MRIEGWVNDAVAKGGQVLAGGKRYGQVYDATIVARCDHKCDLWVEEAFAPVVVVEPYSDFKAAVGAVNASKFGIHAGVFIHRPQQVDLRVGEHGRRRRRRRHARARASTRSRTAASKTRGSAARGSGTRSRT